MKGTLRRLAARLPPRWQQELKRHHYGRQIRTNSFRSGEPEYDLLPSLVSAGDWVVDIGANVGHYTLRLAELVGENGRVISFEPVPETFELLAKNSAAARCRNISLFNAAASSSTGLSGMTVPTSKDSKLSNYYRASLEPGNQESSFPVLCIPVDSLEIPHRIRLVKIDAEEHELSVLRGMQKLLERDHPTLIVEDGNPGIIDVLSQHGYASEKLQGSSNRLFRSRIAPAG